jgi:YggT family protein
MFVELLCQVLAFAILARALMSWIPNASADNPIVRFLTEVTDPILLPLRRVIPNIGMMDLSPLIAMIVLSQIGPILGRSLRGAGL